MMAVRDIGLIKMSARLKTVRRLCIYIAPCFPLFQSSDQYGANNIWPVGLKPINTYRGSDVTVICGHIMISML